MPFHTHNSISHYTLELFDSYQVKHGFFCRPGGVSPEPWSSLNVATSVGDSRENVIANRNLILERFGRTYDSVFDTWQVHSDIVKISDIPRPVEQPHEKGDAVVTDNPEVTLMMVFADCVPLLFFDVEKHVMAIAHAGWQGTVKHIASRTIESMISKYGCAAKNIIAGIGPSIGPDHYEIGEGTASQVEQSFPNNIGDVLSRKDGSIYFDMWTANQLLIAEKGVRDLEVAALCTACDLNNWYSHRAEHGKTGRFAAVITG